MMPIVARMPTAKPILGQEFAMYNFKRVQENIKLSIETVIQKCESEEN